MKLPHIPRYLRGVAAITVISIVVAISLFVIGIPILDLSELKVTEILVGENTHAMVKRRFYPAQPKVGQGGGPGTVRQGV